MKRKDYTYIILSMILMLLLLFIPEKAFASEIMSVDDIDVITLSPEQVGEHYKELKGCKVHTVIWLRDYTLGSPFGKNRADSEEYNFYIASLVSSGKPDKGQYIEIIATIDGKSIGYIDLKNTMVICEGEDAEKILKGIDSTEKKETPDIDGFISKVNEIIEREKEEEAKLSEELFSESINQANEKFNNSADFLTLTPKQLHDNHSELEGMKFHSVFTATNIQKDHFSAKLDPKDWLDSFYFYFDDDIDLREHINKNDYVEVIGEIKPGFWNTAEYTSCQILSIGEDAQAALNEINDNEAQEQVAIDSALGNESEADMVVETLDSDQETSQLVQVGNEQTGEPDLETDKSRLEFAQTEPLKSDLDNIDADDEKKQNIRIPSFNSLEEIITVQDHPKINDLEETARIFYQNAPEGTVAITTWTESLTEYFDHDPDFKVLWFDGSPFDLEIGEITPIIGSVHMNYSSLEKEIDIDTAITFTEAFVPQEAYRRSAMREKYININSDIEDGRRICWIVYYDTLNSEMDRDDLALVFYGSSENYVTESYTSFSKSKNPVGDYLLIDWDTPLEQVLQTVKAEETAPEPIYPEEEIPVSIAQGDSGDNVKEIQILLISLGFLSSAADGKFGPQTRQAVIDFQNAAGLEPNGVIDSASYDILASGQITKQITDTQESTANTTENNVERTVSEPLVWIPTNGGKRYHSKSSCSGMIDPRQVTLSEAEALGFTPCGRCY